MRTYAIIPARSGSKRFKNKNITKLLNTPLFMHSINFANKLKFIDKIILSSDSKKYLNTAKDNKKLIKHLRSKKSSKDTSMEEHILRDLIKFFKREKINYPDCILWLRPTHPLRDKDTFNKAYNRFKRNKKTVMVVHKVDSRLFKSRKKFIYPINDKIKKKSMLRSQDTKPLYSIFSGEFFRLSKKININFLGKQKTYVLAPKYTNFDIDNIVDLNILQNLIKFNYKVYKKFLHNK